MLSLVFTIAFILLTILLNEIFISLSIQYSSNKRSMLAIKTIKAFMQCLLKALNYLFTYDSKFVSYIMKEQ